MRQEREIGVKIMETLKKPYQEGMDYIKNLVKATRMGMTQADDILPNEMSYLSIKTYAINNTLMPNGTLIAKAQSDALLKYLEDVMKYRDDSLGYFELMQSKSETLDQMRNLLNQEEIEIRNSEIEEVNMPSDLLSYKKAMTKIAELATTMLLLDTKKEDEFISTCLSLEMFLDTIDGIVDATLSKDKAAEELTTTHFETLKNYTAQVLTLADTRQQLTENSNKIKMLVSPKSTSE